MNRTSIRSSVIACASNLPNPAHKTQVPSQPGFANRLRNIIKDKLSLRWLSGWIQNRRLNQQPQRHKLRTNLILLGHRLEHANFTAARSHTVTSTKKMRLSNIAHAMRVTSCALVRVGKSCCENNANCAPGLISGRLGTTRLRNNECELMMPK